MRKVVSLPMDSNKNNKKLSNMKLSKILSLGIIVLTAVGFTGCSSDDDDDNAPVVETRKGAPQQVMVVFASGQLGDRGYADRVMDGIQVIETAMAEMVDPTTDVNFLSMSDPSFTQTALEQWVANPVNPFSGSNYQRRLLVLTEPYMLEWLTSSQTALRDSDEVLVLKAVEEDLAEAASLGLGDRLHALNISASRSASRFSQYMDQRLAEEAEYGNDKNINPNGFNLLRLYSTEEVTYRDSICETLRELRGEALELDNDYPVSDLDNYGLYSPLFEEGIVQAAYDCGLMLEKQVNEQGIIFTLVDLGAANLSFDYYLLRQPDYSFTTLMLDTQPSSLRRFAIDRRFDKAFSDWALAWTKAGVGLMQKSVSYSSEEYCQDNIFLGVK